MTSYPIIERRALGPAPKALLRPARRESGELPPLMPDTALVAMVDNRPALLPARPRGSEQALIDASTVLVVDTSPGRQVTIELELGSQTPGEPFVTSISFRCTVADAIEVARKAPRDITADLADYVRQDAELLNLGLDLNVDKLDELRDKVTARLRAIWLGRRPQLAGIDVELANVELKLPEHLRKHASDKRTEEYRQALERMKDQFTFEQARLIEEVLNRGPEAMEALALKLNDANYMNAANRAYATRDQHLAQLLSLTQTFAQGGHLDSVAIDTTQLVDRLVASLLGPAPQDGQGSSKPFAIGLDGSSDGRQPGQLSGASDNGQADIRPEDPPDEESFGG